MHNFRKQGKKFLFIDLKDGSTNEHLQVMVNRQNQPQNDSIGYGDAITVSGTIGKAPRGHPELRADAVHRNGIWIKIQAISFHLRLFSFEIQNFYFTGVCPTDDGFYPFVRKENTTHECIRQYLHLRAHGAQFQSIFRARHLAAQAFYQYFNDNGFTQIHTPILTSNSCEGAGEVIISCNL